MTTGVPMESILISALTCCRIASRPCSFARMPSLYAFCASIQARVSGLFWSSSQRYGSTISTPCTISFTSFTVVLGGSAEGALASLGSLSAVPAAAKTRREESRISREIFLRVMGCNDLDLDLFVVALAHYRIRVDKFHLGV